MIEEYNPVILRSIYEKSVLLVAMRLHSAIFSLSAGTPVIGLYKEDWGPKMPGTLGLLDMEKFVFNISSSNPKNITDSIDELVEKKGEYGSEILKKIERIKNELVGFLKDKV